MNIFLCDSPTLDTGFAKVAQNILGGLNIKDKHVWALGYNGEAHNYDYNLYPANINSNWESEINRNNFANFLFSFGRGTTLFVLHDPFRLKAFNEIFNIHRRNGGKLISYVPVDSPLEPEDRTFFNLSNVIVAYSQYGAEEIKKIAPDQNVVMIPHGYDPFFRKEEGNFKEQLFPKFKNRILIGNVNSNTERKNLYRSLEILSILNGKKSKYAMYFHCNPNGYYDLRKIAQKLGVAEDIIFADPFFEGVRIGKTKCPKEILLAIYNSFDMFLTTTLGEGWGLTVSEAATCEVPICLPRNSSLQELYGQESCLWMEPENTVLYRDNLLKDINSRHAAKLINSKLNKIDPSLACLDIKKHSWENVCFYWNKLFDQV